MQLNKLLCLALLVLTIVNVAIAAKKTKWFHLDHKYSFENYVSEYSKHYESEKEYNFRRSIFESRLHSIVEHNKNPHFTWKRGINHLSDRTEQEFSRLLGYQKSLAYARKSARSDEGGLHLTRTPQDILHINKQYENLLASLPDSVDWRQQLPPILTAIKDQGQCGSCWSFATAETIESHWALAHGNLQDLSEQQVLDCTPNPDQCGGTGGCGGGTTEIAFEQIIQTGGIASEWTYSYASYQGSNQQCKFSTTNTPFQAKIVNYTVLPTNVYAPLLEAVATVGPIAISVDASAWSDYETGVFNGCNQTNPDIDHAVQLVGYGTDSQDGDYWIVRNSWNPFWGEDGFIRIARTSDVQCGIDLQPSDGVGCKDGPANVTVCGTCGILFDNTYAAVAEALD